MKNTNFIVILLCLIANNAVFSQLKVSHFGGIGLGIEPRTDYKLIIKGDLMLTTYPEIPPYLNRFTEFRIRVGKDWPGCEFGTPTGKIAVWSSEIGYNDLYALHYWTASDSLIKKEIVPLEKVTEKLLNLNAYSYKLKNDPIRNNKITFGFLTQEAQRVFPNIIDTVKGITLIDYQQIIPLMLQVLKEQQHTIDSLKNAFLKQTTQNSEIIIEKTYFDSISNELNKIKKQMTFCCNNQIQNQDYPIILNNNSILYQNKPNPFSEQSIIEFDILENSKSASLFIFDMQGALIKTFPIYHTGKGSIIINAYEFKAGMYLYSLIVDDKEIDTKKMILIDK